MTPGDQIPPPAITRRHAAVPAPGRPRARRRRGLAGAAAAVAAVALAGASVASAGLALAGPASAQTPALTVYAATAVDSQTFTGGTAGAADFGRGNYTAVAKPKPVPVVVPESASSSWAPPFVSPDPGSAQAIAYDMVRARGWGDDQFSCLVALWNRESGWRVNAYNEGSGAYGIPQALPGSKMASAGEDWATSAATQITWGLGYISGRYGTPCGAWDHSNSSGWY